MNGTLTLAIFGIILLGLGITILIHAISMKKKEEVPKMKKKTSKELDWYLHSQLGILLRCTA